MNETACDVGIAGLGSIGCNLALNIANHGYSVAAYDRDEMALGALRLKIEGRSIEAANSLSEFVSLLRVPRTVMILLPAGPPIGGVINALVPLLAPGDVVIDAGNSYFKDTDARSNMLAGKGIRLLGVGLSGRERGARHGASIMPGGSADAYDQVRLILEDIATEVNGEPCVAYLGPRSAGHYVEMVYYGIENGVMQLIAETYYLMSRGLGLSDAAIQEVYALWTDSEANSYLLGIIAHIPHGNNRPIAGNLLEMIVDEATPNGSGRWVSLEARALDVSTPIIDTAIAMQMLSSLEEGRVALRKLFIRRPIYYVGKLDILIEQMKRALYAGMILIFAQGLDLLRVASGVYKYDLALGNVARIWRGSIIRSPLLQNICDTFSVQPHLPNLLSDSRFAHCLGARRDDLRDVVRLSIEQGIPAPALTASLVYYDAHRKLTPDDPQVVNRYPVSRSRGNTRSGDAGARSLREREANGRICT